MEGKTPPEIVDPIPPAARDGQPPNPLGQPSINPVTDYHQELDGEPLINPLTDNRQQLDG